MIMQWEFDLLYWFQSLHNPALDAVMKTITKFGDAGLFWIFLTVAILIFVKDKRVGISCATALICEAVIVVILKNVVQRSRPIWLDPGIHMLVKIPKDYSFPSGHSAASFSVAVSIFLYNKKWGTVAIIGAALIAVSRMYLFVHFPTDVLAGTIIGIAMALICGYLVKKRHPEAVLK